MDFSDDHIDLIDENNNVILTYNSSAEVFTANGVKIGRFQIARKPITTEFGLVEEYWQFKSILNFFEIPFPRFEFGGESLIESEVCISKMFLSSPDMFLVKF